MYPITGATSGLGEAIAAQLGEHGARVLMGARTADRGEAAAERIRSRTETTLISLGPGITDRISVSIGVACAPDQAHDRISLLRLADEALYRAKQGGRNCLRVAESAQPAIV